MRYKMSRSLVLLFIALLLNTNSLWTSGWAPCPDQLWFSNDGNCYKVFTEKKVWDEASEHCNSFGGHLLTLETEAEANAVAGYISTMEDDQLKESWFHVGIRRVESYRHNVIMYGTQGFTWVDGTPLTLGHTNYLFWNVSAFDDLVFPRPAESALQGKLYKTSWYIDFSVIPELSLKARERYVCKINKNMFCAPPTVLLDNPTSFLDSRMTPLLCSLLCMMKGYTSYAMIKRERCYCSSSLLPEGLSLQTCTNPCLVEPWLKCAGSSGPALYRTLTYYGMNSADSLASLTCQDLYNNGVIRSLILNEEVCSSKPEPDVPESEHLYCDHPNYFPLRTMCVYVSPDSLGIDYHRAQFDICGQKVHSDLILFNRPIRNNTVAGLYKKTAKRYGKSPEIDFMITTFSKDVATDIPFLDGHHWRYILSGAVTYKMSDHPRNVHGSLSCHWPQTNHSEELSKPHTMTLTLPSKDDYNLVLDRNKDLSVVDSEPFKGGSFGKDVVVMCADIPGELGCREIDVVKRYLAIHNESFNLIVDDPRFLNIYGCIELCRGTRIESSYAYITNSRCYCSSSLEGYIVNRTVESLCFSPCPDPSNIQQCPSVSHLARTFDLKFFPLLASSCEELWINGAYRVGPYQINVYEGGTALVYCHGVPQYDVENGMINGWWTEDTQGQPTDWSQQLRPELFSDNILSFEGVGFHFVENGRRVEINLGDLFLIRGLKTLGRGDYDVGIRKRPTAQGYVTKYNLGYYGLERTWLTADVEIEGNIKHEEDLSIHALSKPVIARRLAIIMITSVEIPVMRIEIFGEAVGTIKKLQALEELQLAENSSLGCYRLEKDNLPAPMIAVNREEAIAWCSKMSHSYLLEKTLGDRTYYHCMPNGRVQVGKVDVFFCNRDLDGLFYQFFDTFDIRTKRCSYPPPAPAGYEWGGVNLVNESVWLKCMEPFSPVRGIEYYKFQCQDNLTWNSDFISAPTVQCGVMTCPTSPPEVAGATVKYEEIVFPGDQATYTCNSGMKWQNNVQQKAICQGSRKWKLTESTQCVSMMCSSYIPGFANTSENLHSGYKQLNPELYMEFSKKEWPTGSFKEIQCPDGTSFSNGQKTAFALCSKLTIAWQLPYGQCEPEEESVYAALSSDEETAGTKSWKQYLPIIILLTLVMLGTLLVYAAFTIRQSHKGEEFKAVDSHKSVLHRLRSSNALKGMIIKPSTLGFNRDKPKSATTSKTPMKQAPTPFVSPRGSYVIPPIVVDDFDRSKGMSADTNDSIFVPAKELSQTESISVYETPEQIPDALRHTDSDMTQHTAREDKPEGQSNARTRWSEDMESRFHSSQAAAMTKEHQSTSNEVNLLGNNSQTAAAKESDSLKTDISDPYLVDTTKNFGKNMPRGSVISANMMNNFNHNRDTTVQPHDRSFDPSLSRDSISPEHGKRNVDPSMPRDSKVLSQAIGSSNPNMPRDSVEGYSMQFVLHYNFDENGHIVEE